MRKRIAVHVSELQMLLVTADGRISLRPCSNEWNVETMSHPIKE